MTTQIELIARHVKMGQRAGKNISLLRFVELLLADFLLLHLLVLEIDLLDVLL